MFDFNENNFINLCSKGEVLMEEIDDFIDRWHDGESQEELHKFLGMTRKEYSLWVTTPSVLPYIITAHKENKDIVELLNEEDRLPLAARTNQPSRIQ